MIDRKDLYRKEDNKVEETSITLVAPWKLYVLVFAIALGGHTIGWNEGLQAGFWQMFTMILFVGSGYLCLALSMSEILSVLPYTGGTYGIVRVALGPFLGYITGWCELVMNLAMTIVSLLYLSSLFKTTIGFNTYYQPIVWVVFFAISFCIQVVHRDIYWKAAVSLSLAVIALWLMYILGSSTGANFDHYHSLGDETAQNEVQNGFSVMPFPSWFYIALNISQILGKGVLEPKKDLPVVTTTFSITAFCTSLIMLFSASSQWPGIMQLAMFRFPLNYGFSRMFQISLKLSSLLSLPAVFTISSGFMSCATHQMSSMANSGLLPRYLKRNIEVENSNSLLAFATCVVICLVVLFPMGYTQYHHRSALFCIAVMASYIVNMIYLSAFIMFRKKYSSLKKFFVNPLGVVGAGYGIFVFLTTFTSAAAFQNDQQIPIIILSGILIFACIYYQLVARTMQCFSEEEQRVLFVAYVINANMRGRIRSKSMRESSFSASRMSFSGGNKMVRGKSISSLSKSTPESAILNTLSQLRTRGSFFVAENSNHSQQGQSSRAPGSPIARVHPKISNSNDTIQEENPNQCSPEAKSASVSPERDESTRKGIGEVPDNAKTSVSTILATDDQTIDQTIEHRDHSTKSVTMVQEIAPSEKRGIGGIFRHLSSKSVKGDIKKQPSFIAQIIPFTSRVSYMERSKSKHWNLFGRNASKSVLPTVSIDAQDNEEDVQKQPVPSLTELAQKKRSPKTGSVANLTKTDSVPEIPMNSSQRIASQRMVSQRIVSQKLNSQKLNSQKSTNEPFFVDNHHSKKNSTDSVHIRGNDVIFRRSLGEVVDIRASYSSMKNSWIPTILLRSRDPNDHQSHGNGDLQPEVGKLSRTSLLIGSGPPSQKVPPGSEAPSANRSPKANSRASWDKNSNLRSSFNAIGMNIAKVMPLFDADFEHYTKEFVSVMLNHFDSVDEDDDFINGEEDTGGNFESNEGNLNTQDIEDGESSSSHKQLLGVQQEEYSQHEVAEGLV